MGAGDNKKSLLRSSNSPQNFRIGKTPTPHHRRNRCLPNQDNQEHQENWKIEIEFQESNLLNLLSPLRPEVSELSDAAGGIGRNWPINRSAVCHGHDIEAIWLKKDSSARDNSAASPELCEAYERRLWIVKKANLKWLSSSYIQIKQEVRGKCCIAIYQSGSICWNSKLPWICLCGVQWLFHGKCWESRQGTHNAIRHSAPTECSLRA